MSDLYCPKKTKKPIIADPMAKSLAAIAKELKITLRTLKHALSGLGITTPKGSAILFDYVRAEHEFEDGQMWQLFDKEMIIDAYLVSIGNIPAFNLGSENVRKSIRLSQSDILCILESDDKQAFPFGEFFPVLFEMCYTTDFSNLPLDNIFLLIEEEAKKGRRYLTQDEEYIILEAINFIHQTLKGDNN